MADRPRLRVLIVEDDSTSRLVLRGILETLDGLEIFEAGDGLQAWEMLDGGLLPQLCFLDLNMPQLNGVELLKRIRNDPRFSMVKACFCTAVRDRQSVVQATALHPDSYILKPYDNSVIEAQVLKAKSSQWPTERIDPPEDVLARLGIEQAAYDFRLDGLLVEARALITGLPLLLMQFDTARALAELDKIHSSARELGAHSLVKIIDELRDSFQSEGDQVAHRDMNMRFDLTGKRVAEILRALRLELQTLMHLTVGDRRRPQDPG